MVDTSRRSPGKAVDDEEPPRATKAMNQLLRQFLSKRRCHSCHRCRLGPMIAYKSTQLLCLAMLCQDAAWEATAASVLTQRSCPQCNCRSTLLEISTLAAPLQAAVCCEALSSQSLSPTVRKLGNRPGPPTAATLQLCPSRKSCAA